MKIIIVSTSLREKSNSQILASEFQRGAEEQGHEVELVTLKNKKIEFCRGCLSCQKTGKCIIKDDVEMIINKMSQAEVIVFVTPLYFYEMSGQLKTLLDRSNPLYCQTNKFKYIYIIGTCADDNVKAFDILVEGIKGWMSCFNDLQLNGVLTATDLTAPSEAMQSKQKILAYELGKKIEEKNNYVR